MNSSSTLILSTIKTSDVRISNRFSREVRSKEDLLKNLIEVNIGSLANNDIDQIIIINSNATELNQSDLTDYYNQHPQLNQLHKDILLKTKILNCNEYSSEYYYCLDYLLSLENSNLILVEEFIDAKLLHLIFLNSKKFRDISILSSTGKILKKKTFELLKKIKDELLERDDKFESLDKNNLYDKYLFEIIDEKWIEEYCKFLKAKTPDLLYYIYGEDPDIIESLKQKTKKQISPSKLSFQSNFDPEQDEIIINDFVILELSSEINFDLLKNKINNIFGKGHTIILIDRTGTPRLKIGKVIYLPNYRELGKYHSSIFLYFSQCRIFSENLIKHIYHLSTDKNILKLLGEFGSISGLRSCIDTIDFNSLNNLPEEKVAEAIKKKLIKLAENFKAQKYPNEIYNDNSHWIIKFKGNTYDLGGDKIGVRIIIEMLQKSKEIKSSSLKEKIGEQSVDDQNDYTTLYQRFKDLLKIVREKESKLSSSNELSDYIKNTVIFTKREKSKKYIIRSENISPDDWKITFPSWYL